MNKSINDDLKKKKIKKVSFGKTIYSRIKSYDNRNNEFFKNFSIIINNKSIKENKFINYNQKKINKNNSQIYGYKTLIPKLNYNIFNKKEITPLNSNSILQSQSSKNFNQTVNNNINNISLKNINNEPIINSLNNSLNLKNKNRAIISFKKDLNKYKIENNKRFIEQEKELNFTSELNSKNGVLGKMSKSQSETFIYLKGNKNNNYPFLNNSNSLTSKNNNFSFREKNLYQLSKSRNITARKIFKYYISQESKDKFKPIKNFEKFLKKKYKNSKNRFNKIYCLNKLHIKRINELKNNRIIAYKDDFNIKDYQYTLLELVKNRIGNYNLFSLGQNYREFNDKMNKKIKPKGRFTNLADKLRNNAPSFLINRLKQMDVDKLIARAKFLNCNISMDENKKFKNENIFKEFNLYMKNKNKSNNKNK